MVGRSKADRPYGTFLGGAASDEEAAPRRRRLDLRGEARRLAARTRSAQLVLVSILATLSIIGITNTIVPVQTRLTEDDVNKAIKTALASATPKPNVAIAAYDAIKESVVLIKTRTGGEAVATARGSGVLLDTGGRVLTSLHVVGGATEIRVTFFDGEEWNAVLGDQQPEYDVAIVEIGTSGRKPAVLASPKDLRVGDDAIVVGSPLGQRNSLSAGVISKLGSTFQPPWSGRQLGGLIQFDAALYPENAGGALVNRRGEVVAIVIGGPSLTGVSGMGFAVPIDSAASAAGANPF